MTDNYGASPDEWVHFDLWLGLTADLLPVVSNPKAIKSPESKIQGPGKTPSRYNGNGQMAGFSKWTQYTASGDDIGQWMKQPDYGICIQTRVVRAIDVDVDDPDEAGQIAVFIAERLGRELPCRARGNAAKFLLAFEILGDFTKRRFKTHKGVIEFLATGQQFVAIGTHPSGARYEWIGGLPNDIPALGADEFEALWSALNEKFGTEESVESRAGVAPGKRRHIDDARDPVVAYLDEHWTVYGQDKSGRVDIECPFAEEHTSDSGESATSYFPAGVGGFEKGHFKCQHSHCAHRTDMDFLGAVGYATHGFEVIEQRQSDPPVLPAFNRAKNGKIEPIRNNLATALSAPHVCGYQLRFDTFLDSMMIAPDTNAGAWREFRDDDYYAIAMRLESGETGFKNIPVEMLRDAVRFTAKKFAFDTAQDWLAGLKWDGVKRIDTFIPQFAGGEDNAYTRAIGRYIWTALAGRVIEPGVKADMVPIAVGEQGLKKTSLVHALVPDGRFAGELDLAEDKKELARTMRGKLILELGELSGFDKRSVEHLKSFVSRQKEEWRPVFKEFNTTMPRRCVFFGTTNNDEILFDESGNRRWLPFRSKGADPEGAAAIRDQLWAEGAALFRESGVQWQDAERLAKIEHAHYIASDPWDSAVRTWLDTPDEVDGTCPAERGFTIADALSGAVRLDFSRMDQRVKNRMARVLKKFGFESKSKREGGGVRRIYQRVTTATATA